MSPEQAGPVPRPAGAEPTSTVPRLRGLPELDADDGRRGILRRWRLEYVLADDGRLDRVHTSSEIVVVSRETGKVVYAGWTSDAW
jgi:hypothetical protein